MELTTISYIPAVKQYMQRDEAWSNVARDLAKIQQARRDLEAQEKIYIDRLKIMSAGESSEYGNFRFEKTIRKGAVDYKSIPELQAIDLEQYRGKEVESWKLTILV